MDFSEVIIRSTKGDIIGFKKSLLAKDMKREILVLKRMAEREYREAKTLIWKGNIDGRIEALERVLEMPDRFIQRLEDIEEEEDDSGRSKTE